MLERDRVVTRPDFSNKGPYYIADTRVKLFHYWRNGTKIKDMDEFVKREWDEQFISDQLKIVVEEHFKVMKRG